MIFEPFFLESYMTGIKEMISPLGNTGTDLCRLRAAYIFSFTMPFGVVY